MKLKDCINAILGLHKTVIVNFKLLPLNQAIKLPILISKNVKIRGLSGNVEIKSPIKTGLIKFGFGDVGIYESRKTSSIFNIDGKAIFNGRANFGIGARINVLKGAEMIIGKNFCINADSTVICKKKVSFGDNFLMSWECLIMDTDFHTILDSYNKKINQDKEIIIGSNVWIGCRTTIFKGTTIGNNVVVGANSNVHGKIEGNNQVIGGSPIKVLKENIHWEI